jgi:hypothetical protein
MQLITTTEDLVALCERVARHPFVTVDTEFLRESTYYPKLCIAQLATIDEVAIVDALARDIDLAPFYALMADERVIKVFHAARQDIEICWHAANVIPAPVVDTQVAAMVLGYGDSISYDQLVQRITGNTLDKSNRFTDWTQRPLSDAQLHYAICDVTHLRDVYAKLSQDLDRQGRVEWMREEMGVLTSPDTYRMEPGEAWHRRNWPSSLKSRLGVNAKPKPATSRADVSSRTMPSAISPYRLRPRSNGSRACDPYREGLKGRNGARQSLKRSTGVWHVTTVHYPGSSAPSRPKMARQRSNYSRSCSA